MLRCKETTFSLPRSNNKLTPPLHSHAPELPRASSSGTEPHTCSSARKRCRLSAKRGFEPKRPRQGLVGRALYRVERCVCRLSVEVAGERGGRGGGVEKERDSRAKPSRANPSRLKTSRPRPSCPKQIRKEQASIKSPPRHHTHPRPQQSPSSTCNSKNSCCTFPT